MSDTLSVPHPLLAAERVARRRPTFLALVLLVVSVSFVVMYVSNVIAVNELGAEITALDAERRVAADRAAALRAEISQLERPERIAAIAREKLGLSRPDSPPVPLRDAR
jgi:cell division protein FtsL